MKKKPFVVLCALSLLLGSATPVFAAEQLVALPDEHQISIQGHPATVYFQADVYEDPTYGPQCSYSSGDCMIPAADLRQYGFEVVWHEDTRCVTIAPKEDFAQTVFPTQPISHPSTFTPAPTDMKAYGGHNAFYPIRSLYSNGKLFVNLYDVFSKFGTFTTEDIWENGHLSRKTDFVIKSSVPAVKDASGQFVPLKDAFAVSSLYSGVLVSKTWEMPVDTETEAPAVSFYDLSIFDPETETSQYQSYIGFEPNLLSQMGLLAKTEGNKTSVSFADEPKSTSFMDYEVYVMSEPVNIYTVDLNLTDESGNIVPAEGIYPVFLSIKGTLCIRTDVLADTLGLQSSEGGYTYLLPETA